MRWALLLVLAACASEPASPVPDPVPEPVPEPVPTAPLTPPVVPVPIPAPLPAGQTLWVGCGEVYCYRLIIPIAEATGLRLEPAVTYLPGWGNAGYIVELYNQQNDLLFRYGYGYYWNDFLHECPQCLVNTTVTLMATRGVLWLYTGPFVIPPGYDMSPVSLFEQVTIVPGAP